MVPHSPVQFAQGLDGLGDAGLGRLPEPFPRLAVVLLHPEPVDVHGPQQVLGERVTSVGGLPEDHGGADVPSGFVVEESQTGEDGGVLGTFGEGQELLPLLLVLLRPPALGHAHGLVEGAHGGAVLRGAGEEVEGGLLVLLHSQPLHVVVAEVVFGVAESLGGGRGEPVVGLLQVLLHPLPGGVEGPDEGLDLRVPFLGVLEEDGDAVFHVPFPEQFEGLFQFRVGCHGRRKMVCDIKVGRSFSNLHISIIRCGSRRTDYWEWFYCQRPSFIH